MALNIPFKYAKPVLHALDPEDAHGFGIRALKMGAHPTYSTQDPRLKISLFNKEFSNPVGLAAGFDKNAEVIAPILKTGFGFTEVGTVTPRPQSGNPRPRVFRDPSNDAVINRMGFPNKGYAAFIKNIQRTKKPNGGVIGINVGMNKEQTEPAEDYCALITRLSAYADYFTINISSPNTPGLRNLQAPEFLSPLLREVKKTRDGTKEKPALLIKLAPDLTPQEQEEIAGVLITEKIDGIILTNTTLGRPGVLPQDFANETGGLSGNPLKEKSNEICRNFYKLTKGQIPIIGAGGISNAQDAYERIKSGASLIQLYTAMIFKGPDIAKNINEELITLLERDGFNHIQDAIGQNNK